jgi:putative tRNA adenosine deaminase-associated protein
LLGQLLAASDAGVEELLDLAEPAEDQIVDEVDDEEPNSVLTGPTGDADLLADLGLAPNQLLELAGREGMLPTEALAEIAERAGCAEALESVR